MQTGARSALELKSRTWSKNCSRAPAAPPRACFAAGAEGAQAPVAPAFEGPAVAEIELHAEPEPLELRSPPPRLASEPEFEGEFDVNRLSPEEQNCTPRKSVAKVSIAGYQDAPAGAGAPSRQTKTSVSIERRHLKKLIENTTAFQTIMDHPIDYFYRWLVEILAEGDAHALGEYPYSTPRAPSLIERLLLA